MKYLKWSIILILPIGLILYFTMKVEPKAERYESNPELKFIKDGWKGNPIDSDCKFVNHEFPFKNDFNKVIKWKLSRNPQREEKENDTFRLKVQYAKEFLESKDDGMLWVGHASYLFRINGKLMISDPIFTTPISFMKRYSKLPFDPNELTNLDYILITHDHHDHLSKESIKLLVKNNPKVKVLTGLRLGKYIEDWLDGAEYQEAGWYQQYNIVSDDIKITFMPTRHWSYSGFLQFNKRLWGAFHIQSNDVSIYYCSDSGWGSHFKEAGELFSTIDYAIIGVGAYKPEWFMGPVHTSPADALKATEQMKARNLIPTHFGTFDLSDEPIGEPYREVNRLHVHYTDKFDLINLYIGEFLRF